MSEPRPRTLHLEVQIESGEDLAALEGALLAARAFELGEIKRRAGRHSFGYGSDSARETMSDEVVQLRRRWEVLHRLLISLAAASTTER